MAEYIYDPQTQATINVKYASPEVMARGIPVSQFGPGAKEEAMKKVRGGATVMGRMGEMGGGPAKTEYYPEGRQELASWLQKQISDLQSQIQKYQRVIEEAKTAGASPKEPIPAEIWEKYQISLPTTPPDLRIQDQIIDSTTAYLKWMQAEQQRLAKLEEGAEEERKSWFEKTKELIMARPSYEEKLEAERKRWGVPEFYEKLIALTPEIEALRTRIVQEEARFQRGLEVIEQKPMAMPLILGEQAALQRQWAIEKSALTAELGVKVAMAEMYRGNIDLANRLISQTIEAQLYDIKQKVDDYKYFFEYYDDYIKTLDTKRQNALRDIMDLLIRQEDLERRDLELKYDLIQNAWRQGIDPMLSSEEIKDKSYEEIMEIVGPKIAAVAGKEVWSEPYTLPTGETAQRNLKTGEIRIISKGETAREFTDEEIRAVIRGEQAKGVTYQEMLDLITLSPSIANKDRARLIAAELYGQPIPEEFKEKPALPEWMKGKTEEEIRKEMERLTIPTTFEWPVMPMSTSALWE